MPRIALFTLALAILPAWTPAADPPAPDRMPLFRVIDLDLGEAREVKLAGGKTVMIKLVDLVEVRDAFRNAVREARVKVEVDGHPATLVSANYRLPIEVGAAQVDCPITSGYRTNTTEDHWGLVKAARLRLWPAGSPWIEPGTFAYPARQRWFASDTQMANEPTFVDGGENPRDRKIYYHSGLDIGGAEGLVDVVAATDGLIVSSATSVLPGSDDTPVQPRYDVVYVRDDRGWYYRYSHFQSIAARVRPGRRVTMGEKLGVLGKEGGSGGWSHLHFEIVCRQPSGQWGTQEGYAFLWEAYQRQYKPALVAVARPHRLAVVGEPVVLDGSRSWSRSARIVRFEWTFTDGESGTGPEVKRTYNRPGQYSEILKVSDDQGHVTYDFAVVQVLDRSQPDRLPPSIQAAYAPTLGLKAGDPVTFAVRTFRTTDGHETWDFGDGSPRVTVRSDGNIVPLAKDGFATTIHHFKESGDYVVRVERSDQRGDTAIGHLHVKVGDE